MDSKIFLSARQSIFALCILHLALLFHGCAISYKFNGASIDYSTTRSIAIAEFPNHAALVNPSLSSSFTEELRDLYQRTTRLIINRQGGDLELEGEITNYTVTPMAVAADSYASETKLTITIRVRFTNNVKPEENFEKTYSAFQTFDSSKLLTDVQDELCEIMIAELTQNIYNDTVAKW